MGSYNNFDEKQLIDRGKAYQYGFIAAIFAIVLTYIVKEAIGIKIDPYASFLFCLWVPLTTCFIVSIVKDAYDSVNSTSGRLVSVIFGFAGLFIFVYSTLKIALGKEILLDNGMITESVGHIFNGICLITISIVYWVKQNMNKRKYNDNQG